MSHAPERPERIEQALADRLRAGGYRLTPARRSVIRALAGGDHHASDELLAEARREHPRLGRATVYRTLETLTSLGALRPVHLGGRELAYLVALGGHHHFVCTRCRRVLEIEDCPLEPVETELEERHGFRIEGHLLELYGACRDCEASAA